MIISIFSCLSQDVITCGAIATLSYKPSILIILFLTSRLLTGELHSIDSIHWMLAHNGHHFVYDYHC